jgi:hypothetical protein
VPLLVEDSLALELGVEESASVAVVPLRLSVM